MWAETMLRILRRITGRDEGPPGVRDEATARLFERLDFLRLEPTRILDLGCGTGRLARRLKQRYPAAEVLAMDVSTSVLRTAARRQGWLRTRFHCVAGDPHAPPLARSSVDLIFSSLILPLCKEPRSVLASLRRVVRPGGLVLVSTLGPDTLAELRGAGLGAVAEFGFGHTTDVQQLGEMLVGAGFSEPVLDTDWLTTTHAGMEQLLREVDDIAGRRTATRSDGAGQRATPFPEWTGARLPDGRISVTWEVVYASAWGPEEGQPIRTAGGEEASVSVTSIGRRRPKDT